ncbi:MAG: hypothetical protein ACLP50_20075 [Solirubrobacteraceae bacterium]
MHELSELAEIAVRAAGVPRDALEAEQWASSRLGVDARRVVDPEIRRRLRAALVGAVLQFEEEFDDGVSVIVEFASPRGERHSLGIYIDHILGGLVKDGFVGGPLSTVRALLSGQHWRTITAALRSGRSRRPQTPLSGPYGVRIVSERVIRGWPLAPSEAVRFVARAAGPRVSGLDVDRLAAGCL